MDGSVILARNHLNCETFACHLLVDAVVVVEDVLVDDAC